jgi:hypothetical protein
MTCTQLVAQNGTLLNLAIFEALTIIFVIAASYGALLLQRRK